MSHPRQRQEQSSRGRGWRSQRRQRQQRDRCDQMQVTAAATRLHSTSAQIVLHLEEKLQARPPGIANRRKKIVQFFTSGRVEKKSAGSSWSWRLPQYGAAMRRWTSDGKRQLLRGRDGGVEGAARLLPLTTSSPRPTLGIRRPLILIALDSGGTCTSGVA